MDILARELALSDTRPVSTPEETDSGSEDADSEYDGTQEGGDAIDAISPPCQGEDTVTHGMEEYFIERLNFPVPPLHFR